MNLTEVKKSLDHLFSRDLRQGGVRNIVFWYDEEGVFADDIDCLDVKDVKIIKLYHNNMFAVKLYIEETDRESSLLVYSPFPRPANKENWLTDTIKYSQVFSTDETSLNLMNFRIDAALRAVVDKYKLFFRSGERCKKFESYALAPYTENRIHLGVLSVLLRLPAPNLDHAVQSLLIEMARGESALYGSIKKYGDPDALWRLIQDNYGYSFPDQSLTKLAILLLCSHLSHGINGNMPGDWKAFVSHNSNCYVFVDNFMKNVKLWSDYNIVAEYVADKLKLYDRVAKWAMDEFAECDTFEDFDKSILRRVTENISQGAGGLEQYKKLINSRKNRRYYRQFEAEYDVLFNACEYLSLSQKYKDLPGATIAKLFESYVKSYYRLDSSYRHFLNVYDRLKTNERYTALYEMVELSYTNWYLNELSMKWCALWDDEPVWQVAGVSSQQGFYEKYVQRSVYDNARIIVIISDGLRYESAVELSTILNREQKGASELDVMLGAIPSYTALGMASLLPHKRMSILESGDYAIDGISTKGTENRSRILQAVKEESIAIVYDDVMKLSKQQMGETFAGKKLIYIYHNTIDARGDNAHTEHGVFDATEKAFRELNGLVRKLCNDISAIQMIITADHGYLYRRTPLAQRDKTPKEEAAGVESKRRFILSKENIEKQGTQSFSMDYLLKGEPGLYAVIPRATNCFSVQGSGSCYVHGGLSLQEVAIPVIRFRNDKNLNRSMSARKVSLNLTNLSRKITSVISHLTFFQNEPADEKHLPLRVTAYFADEAGNRISNENIIIADSTSAKPDERTYKEKFTLKDMAYDKSKTYYLVLKDKDELVNTGLERIPFIIDLVFGGSIHF